jgi:hypothetical protein
MRFRLSFVCVDKEVTIGSSSALGGSAALPPANPLLLGENGNGLFLLTRLESIVTKYSRFGGLCQWACCFDAASVIDIDGAGAGQLAQ